MYPQPSNHLFMKYGHGIKVVNYLADGALASEQVRLRLAVGGACGQNGTTLSAGLRRWELHPQCTVLLPDSLKRSRFTFRRYRTHPLTFAVSQRILRFS